VSLSVVLCSMENCATELSLPCAVQAPVYVCACVCVCASAGCGAMRGCRPDGGGHVSVISGLAAAVGMRAARTDQGETIIKCVCMYVCVCVSVYVCGAAARGVGLMAAPI
jgi:hypothetical protein